MRPSPRRFRRAVIAVDTNILVRLLTEDDAEQFARAQALFAVSVIFIPKTVVLETEWVLRRAYRRQPAAVIDALAKLVSLHNVTCEDEPALHRALALARDGMDFASALHLASSHRAERFATFDAGLVEEAARHGLPAIAP